MVGAKSGFCCGIKTEKQWCTVRSEVFLVLEEKERLFMAARRKFQLSDLVILMVELNVFLGDASVINRKFWVRGTLVFFLQHFLKCHTTVAVSSLNHDINIVSQFYVLVPKSVQCRTV